jgi:ABC-type transport system involved in cytochrome bd biosynthesis fused ATPase/permease subunit
MKVNLLNHRLSSPKKDLLAVTVVSFAVFVVAIRSRLFALLLRTQQRQPLMIDESSFLLLLLLLAVAVFALRHWSDLRKERARLQIAEQAADTREQAFNQIVEQADEMIYRTDARGHFVL